MRMLLLFCGLLWFQIMNAQYIIVDSCKLSDVDPTESSSPRMDFNGERCSIVKVFANNINGKLEFKGNIIGDIPEFNHIYKIYLPAKTKRLIVYHPDYIPQTIRFTDYEESKHGLEYGKMYYLYLSVPDVSQPVKSSVPEGSRVLLFTSNKDLQTLIVDGLEWKIIDSKTSKRLISYGTHKYEAISTDGTHISGDVNLQPSIGSEIIKLNFEK